MKYIKHSKSQSYLLAIARELIGTINKNDPTQLMTTWQVGPRVGNRWKLVCIPRIIIEGSALSVPTHPHVDWSILGRPV